MIGNHRHFIDLNGFNSFDLTKILNQAHAFKKGDSHSSLAKKRVGLVFLKASTRTKVSFESAIHSLGGESICIDKASSQLGRGEPLSDTVKVLERYVHAIMIRNDSQKDIEAVAEFSKVPIINGLSELAHPCQAVADIMTLQEYKTDLNNIKVVYLGEGNNVALSLAKACQIMRIPLTIVTPINFECPANEVAALDYLGKLKQNSNSPINSCIEFKTAKNVYEVKEFVNHADAIYTDTWSSMGSSEGKESNKEERKLIFAPFQVNQALLNVAKKDCIFLHCLPAYRGNEVSAEVLDGPQSVVFDQAENRMHAQKAILHLLIY